MPSVWYVKGFGSRTIRATDWAAAGLTGNTVTFDQHNGWSISHSQFTADQIAYLANQHDFLVNQFDGPRPYPPPTAFGTPAQYSESVYYSKTKELYDQTVAMIGNGSVVSTAQVQTMINNAVAAVVGGADSSFDTLGEVAAYLNTIKAGADPTGDTFAELFALASGRYQKPGAGIPATDLAAAVQDLLNRIGGADAEYLANAYTTMPRYGLGGTNSLLSGYLDLTYRTCAKARTINQLSCQTGSAGVSGTAPTMIRAGLYRQESNGDVTLLGSSANGAGTKLTGTFQRNTFALTTPVNIVQGVRYAVGVLVVTTGTICNIYGQYCAPAQGFSNFPDRLATRNNGAALTDLPATIANAGFVGLDHGFWWDSI